MAERLDAQPLNSEPLVFSARVTDECLERIIKAPSNFPAWVIRAVAVELKQRRQMFVKLASMPAECRPGICPGIRDADGWCPVCGMEWAV